MLLGLRFRAGRISILVFLEDSCKERHLSNAHVQSCGFPAEHEESFEWTGGKSHTLAGPGRKLQLS